MQKTKTTDERAVKGGLVTAKATAKSQFLLACWFAEVGDLCQGLQDVPSALCCTGQRGESCAAAAKGPPAHGRRRVPLGASSRGVWPWGVGSWTWVLITHLLFWSSVPKGGEQMLWAPTEIQGKCIASGLSSATWEQPKAAARAAKPAPLQSPRVCTCKPPGDPRGA